MSVSKYTLPSPVYLPSSGGHTSSRMVSEPFHRRVFAFRRYSMEEDGRLVARTRNVGRDFRNKPYERLPPSTIQPKKQEVPPTSQNSLPRKQVDVATLGRLFQQLAPLTKDPLGFESNAAAICASFDLDPATSTEIVSSFKQQLPTDRTQGSNPSATSGPTVSPIVEPPTDTPSPISVPVKHQRPFASGPKGSTVWYSTSSSQPLASPPTSLPAVAGMLYLHTDIGMGTKQVWLCNINRNWVEITAMENVKHPSISDRVFLLRSDGIPSWLTTVSYAAVQSRKEMSGR